MEADEVEDSRGIRSIEVQDKMENVWRNLHTKKGIRYAEKSSIGNTPCPSLCCTQNEVGFEKSQRKNKNQSACNKFSEP